MKEIMKKAVKLLVLVSIVFAAMGIQSSAAMNKAQIFKAYTITSMISGGIYQELNTNQYPAEDFVYYYMINSGLLEPYKNQNSYYATLSYKTYDSLVGNCFAKKTSMKKYLTNHGYYNKKTGNVTVYFGGGYGDPVSSSYVNAVDGGNVLYGVWADWSESATSGVEGIDYRTEEFTDEYGNLHRITPKILKHVKVTINSKGKITSYKMLSKAEAKKYVSYTISYDMNGGQGSISSQTKGYNTSIKLSKKVPARTGYTFKGWSTTAGTSVVNYKSGAVFSGNCSIKLYAVWESNKYQIAYNKNGGSGSMQNQTMSYQSAARLSANQFYREGYKFIGWNTKADGSGKSYRDRENVNNLTSANGKTITLYAKWQKGYKVSFYSQSMLVSEKYVYQGEEYGDLPHLVNDNQYFLGWFDQDLSKVDAGTTITRSKSHAVKAEWMKKHEIGINCVGENMIQVRWSLPKDATGAALYCNGKIIRENITKDISDKNITVKGVNSFIYNYEVNQGSIYTFYVVPYRRIGNTKCCVDINEAKQISATYVKQTIQKATWSANMADTAKSIDMYRVYNPRNMLTSDLMHIRDATPQGMCVAENYILITLYKAKSAYIVVLDKESGKELAVMRVAGFDEFMDLEAHVGGIAYDDNGHIWVSGTGKNKVYRINIDVIVKAITSYGSTKKMYSLVSGKDYKEFFTSYTNDKKAPYANPSFLTCHNGSLYVGSFEKNKAGELCEFRITQNGLCYVNSIAIPDKIQGAVFINDNKLILSKSYGRKNASELYCYNVTSSGLMQKKNVTLPPMSEEIEIIDGYLYILYESSAKKYRNGCPNVQEKIWAVNMNQLSF